MKHNLINTKKCLVSMVSVILVLMPLLAILVVGCHHSAPPFSKASDETSAELVKRWGITSFEFPEYGLSIPLADPTRLLVLVQDPKSGKVDQVIISYRKPTVRNILEYRDKGIFGLPEVHLSRPSELREFGTSLVDYNVDATFDALYGVGPKGMGMYISLPSGWVGATAKNGPEKGATTVDGKKYQFDVTTGKWRPMD
ncbi:MAG: hypothetical protein QGH60_16795 [Phycisphaerae bacterium]|jgi:hypothetical protein|nr:hypothetical protein [Phycisphaerae bacterium]